MPWLGKEFAAARCAENGDAGVHIKRIAVRNFRNFEDIEIEDLPEATVIVGENGTGKSNLLHALRLVLDPSLADTARYLAAEDFWDGLPNGPFVGDAVEVDVDLTGFDDDTDAKAVLGTFAISKKPFVARLSYSFGPIGADENGDVSAANYRPSLYGGGDRARTIGRDVLRFVSIRVLPALRDAEGELHTARNPLRRLLERLDVEGDELEPIAQAIDSANAGLLEIESVKDLSDALAKRIGRLVGQVFAIETSLGLASTRPDQLLRAVRLFVDGERKRTVGQASLGAANVLYLSLLLEEIEMREASQETVSTILAVEEPEAHLHPHLQRVLFRQLVRSGRPILVTTHSPHLASVVPLRSLVLLQDIGGSTVVAQVPQGLLSDEEERDLERYLDVTRAELLFAKAVVLVEGIAELYLVPAAASVAGVDLDEHGISVCSVHGTDFVPYAKLLGEEALDLDFVVITDGDVDKDGKSRGVRRSIGICPSVTDRLEEAVETDDDDAAREILREEGVFIGEKTLELDVLPLAQACFKTTYSGLVSSKLARARFDELVDASTDDPESARKVLARIERLGKGRFAQRLVEHLYEEEHFPPYIRDALDQLLKWVDGDDAE